MDWKSVLVFKDVCLSPKDTLPESLKNSFLDVISRGSEDGEIKYDILNELFIEFISSYLNGKIQLTHALTLLQSCGFSDSPFVTSAFVAALWFWGTQYPSSIAEDNKTSKSVSAEWTKIHRLAVEVTNNNIVDKFEILTQLELDYLVTPLTNEKSAKDVQLRVRKANTTMKFRQDAFNILREESEGYSKLVTILSSLPPPPCDPSSYIRNIFSVIGCFDLDPKRVLDLTIDIFENQIWNSSFLSILNLFEHENIGYTVGFKFRSYQIISLSEDKESLKFSFDATKATPSSLFKLTSLLIMNKTIDLEDISPYLLPTPVETVSKDKIREEEMERQIKTFGVVSLTARAVETVTVEKDLKEKDSKDSRDSKDRDKDKISSTNPDGTPSAQSLSSPPPLPLSSLYAEGDQYAGLIAGAFSLRYWSLGSDIMRLHTKLGGGGSDFIRIDAVRDALIDLISWVIEPVYATIAIKKLGLARPLVTTTSTTTAAVMSSTATTNATFNASAIQSDPIIPVSENQYPQIHTLADVPVKLEPLLRMLGHRLHANPILFTKICRLFAACVKNTSTATTATATATGTAMEIFSPLSAAAPAPTTATTIKDTTENDVSKAYQDIITLVSSCILPALSCMGNNAAAASSSVWNIISTLPFAIRFQIYQLWRGEGMGKAAVGLKPNEVVLAEVKAAHTVRSHMKRLAKENVKQIGKVLGLAIHSNPMVAYDYILTQVEYFDNLIPFIVEALRNTTDLSRDTLAFSFIIQLQKDSNKLKKGDTHYSQWFSSLSKFIASFYRRHPNTEIKALFHFLLRKVASGETLDLLVLKEILTRMGGCEMVVEVSANQFDALGCGRSLKAEILGAQVKDAGKKVVNRLREELIASGTAIPLLLLIAQARTRLLHRFEAPQLKLISYLYDTCQEVLMQFTDFLIVLDVGKKGAGLEDLLSLMPSMRALLTDFGLNVPVAFQLVRPIIRAALEYGEDPLSAPLSLQCWHPFGNDMSEIVREHLPVDTFEFMSPQLYMMFWSLSLYDLSTPKNRYDLEAKRLKEKWNQMNLAKGKGPVGGVGAGGGGVGGIAADKLSKIDKDQMSRLLDICTLLNEEKDAQFKHTESIRRILLSQKDNYFIHVKPENIPRISEILIQHCIYPRILMSPTDAMYCSHFFMLLNDLNTPLYDIISVVNNIHRTIIPLLFCSTENEASFLGYGMCELLKRSNNWHSSRQIFESELSTKVGFNVCRTQFSYFSNKKKLDKNWHDALRQAVCNCLKSSEYMHMRSALIFLTKITDKFPTRAATGKLLLDSVGLVEKLGIQTDREDLHTLARGVLVILRRKEKDWIDDSPSQKGIQIPSLANKGGSSVIPAVGKPNGTTTTGPPPSSVPPPPRGTPPTRPGSMSSSGSSSSSTVRKDGTTAAPPPPSSQQKGDMRPSTSTSNGPGARPPLGPKPTGPSGQGQGHGGTSNQGHPGPASGPGPKRKAPEPYSGGDHSNSNNNSSNNQGGGGSGGKESTSSSMQRHTDEKDNSSRERERDRERDIDKRAKLESGEPGMKSTGPGVRSGGGGSSGSGPPPPDRSSHASDRPQDRWDMETRDRDRVRIRDVDRPLPSHNEGGGGGGGQNRQLQNDKLVSLHHGPEPPPPLPAGRSYNDDRSRSDRLDDRDRDRDTWAPSRGGGGGGGPSSSGDFHGRPPPMASGTGTGTGTGTTSRVKKRPHEDTDGGEGVPPVPQKQRPCGSSGPQAVAPTDRDIHPPGNSTATRRPPLPSRVGSGGDNAIPSKETATITSFVNLKGDAPVTGSGTGARMATVTVTKSSRPEESSTTGAVTGGRSRTMKGSEPSVTTQSTDGPSRRAQSTVVMGGAGGGGGGDRGPPQPLVSDSRQGGGPGAGSNQRRLETSVTTMKGDGSGHRDQSQSYQTTGRQDDTKGGSGGDRDRDFRRSGAEPPPPSSSSSSKGFTSGSSNEGGGGGGGGKGGIMSRVGGKPAQPQPPSRGDDRDRQQQQQSQSQSQRRNDEGKRYHRQK
eukprot:gene7237-14767_t